MGRPPGAEGCDPGHEHPEVRAPDHMASERSLLSPDLVERQFERNRPNRLRMANFTDVHTWSGVL